MSRFLGVLAFIVMSVVILFWAVAKVQEVPLQGSGGGGEMVNTPVVLRQAQLVETSTANAQETATADILFAHDRATFAAATSTQNAARTQAVIQQTQAVIQQTQAALQQTQAIVLQQTQVQFVVQLTADSATERAKATAAQQAKVESAAGTTTAIAAVISSQTQSVITTQQSRAEQVRQSEMQQRDATAFISTWGPLLFLLVVSALCAWAFWYLEIHKRVRQKPSGELPAPVFDVPSTEIPVLELPLPEAEVVVERDLITEPDGEVNGWMDEVKESLLASEKEDYDNPNA